MKALPQTKKKNGYTYHKIAEEKIGKKRYAIYKQFQGDNLIGCELFEIKTAKEVEIMGRIVEEHEVFPSNEDFGKHAWSFKTSAECYWKLESLLKRFIQDQK